jgi:peptidoglycan/xylan/chitin deacetylase (PgdA/CDA1 family)
MTRDRAFLEAHRLRPAVAALAAGGVLFLSASSLTARRTAFLEPGAAQAFLRDEGGVIRGDASRKTIALIFTGGDFADGGPHIRTVLAKKGIKAGFFFTGDFYRSPEKRELIRGLAADGHYLGPHSDKHLLYCSWEDRAKTLVTKDEFERDILANYEVMTEYGIRKEDAPYFIPPYEWYNTKIVEWSAGLGLALFNFTPGTSSNADYTTPDMKEYLSSEEIYRRILAYEKKDPKGLNGFILLIHIGTAPERTDKLYLRLENLIDEMTRRGYTFVRIDTLLSARPHT